MASPDLVITGRIATLADREGFGWVEALAVTDGRVAAVGRVDEIVALAGRRTRRIHLGPGQLAIPGLTDAHIHLMGAAIEAGQVDLTDDATLAEGLDRIALAHEALPADAWLEGHGWDADRWGGWPTADDLERVAPGRAAVLWAHDHHSYWVSPRALVAAGVDRATVDPAGGSLRRDTDGTPTGVLHENASRLVSVHVPRLGSDETAAAIEAFGPRLLALGVVAVHDPGSLSPDGGMGRAVEAYERLAAGSALPLRIHAAIRPESLETAIARGIRSADRLSHDPDARIRFGWLKLFADGTLGSRTAALLAPWEPGSVTPDDPPLGVFTTPADDLARTVARATATGIASQIHAIGDAAVRAALDALAPSAGRTALSPRIEHVQLVDPADLPRFSRQGIAASVQPVHLRNDAPAARLAWGPRAERSSYPWGSLAASGALIPFGTDAPVESIDPWPGIALAVTRFSGSWGGRRIFGHRERIPLDRAIRAACIDGPASAGETERGRLIPGQRADIVVLPAATFDDPPDVDGPLGTARPQLVLVDGRVVHRA